MKLCFVGDWMPRRAIDGPFQDRLLVGNLECAFSDDDVESSKAYTSVLQWRDADNIPLKNVFALSLANNHVYDAGAATLDEMRERLMKKFPHIQFFRTVDRPYADIELDGKRYAVIGALESCRSRGALLFKEEDVTGLIFKIRRDYDFEYIYPHWGKEGEYTRWPSPRQRKLAKEWIDAGADAVLGSHSHVFQGREFYKGKPIYHSLGNFYFPHPESRLYEGTHDGLTVEIADGAVVEHYHHFDDDGTFGESKFGPETMVEISQPLCSWSTWKWAKAVGPFNLKKNSASWRIRLKKNLIKTLPKFLVWQGLPQTLLFRIASLCH